MAATTSRAKLDQLRAIPLFADLSNRTLSRLSRSLTEVEAPAGSVLIQNGEPGSGLLIVMEGSVAVERPGKRLIELGPGEFLGELALLTAAGVHRARVRARTPVTLLAMSRADFSRILKDDPRIAVAMLPVLATRVIQD